MAHDWRKGIAASVLALAAGTGLAAEAAAQTGGDTATAGASSQRLSEREVRAAEREARRAERFAAATRARFAHEQEAVRNQRQIDTLHAKRGGGAETTNGPSAEASNSRGARPAGVLGAAVEQAGELAEGTTNPTDVERCDPIELERLREIDAIIVREIDTIINGCIKRQTERLLDSDNRTRWFSWASGVGGFGAVAAGIAGQGASAINPWLALGVTPGIIDDVQQRENWSSMRRDFIARVDQLHCRAQYLERRYSSIDPQGPELKGWANSLVSLENALWEAREHYESKANESTAEGQFRLIYEEAQRQLNEARLLQRYLAGVPPYADIVRQEAIAFNYLNTELQTFRSAMLARPDTTFRSLLAAPLRATTNFIAGTPGATQPASTSSLVTRVNGEFKGRYLIAIEASLSDVRGLKFAIPSLHVERVGRSREQAALGLLNLVTAIAARSEQLQGQLASFVDTAVEQNPAACRTYNAPAPATRDPPATTEPPPVKPEEQPQPGAAEAPAQAPKPADGGAAPADAAAPANEPATEPAPD